MMKMMHAFFRPLAALLILAMGIAFVPHAASSQPVLLKDLVKPAGVTSNQLVGYGIVTGLNNTGDSTSAIFTSQTIQNVLLSFGLTTTTTNVRTRNVAAVTVTANLPAFAHSGDDIDVLVSSMGDATSLQGGTLILTELKGPNNLVYATAQGPISIGGFSAVSTGTGENSITRNHPTAGRIPLGGVIARDMVTPLTDSPNAFSYVLSTPDYKTAARVAGALNARFGGGVAGALDAETVRINMPAAYAGRTVDFLADAGDVQVDQDHTAKVVLNERTGTVVMGGDVGLAPCAIAHGNLSITISTNNQFVPPGPFTNAPGGRVSNTTISATESGRHLIYINGAATLAQVVRALNTIGVSPRDLIAIVQSLRESGSLQAEVEII